MPQRQEGVPLVVRGKETTRLHRVPLEERTFDEEWLQQLLFDHPALLPIEEIEPIFAGARPIVRELQTEAGRLDLLYMNPSGFLTIAETKLWRNPEARREAVAQVIHYASELARWSYEDLVTVIRQKMMCDEKDPLIELMQEADSAFDEKQFIDQVGRNLQLGRILLLIVGDGIQTGVERMAEFLQKTPHLGFTLGLVEIALFREHPQRNDPLFVQPRVLARTREVTRATVEIKVPIGRADVQVTLPVEKPPEPPGRHPITEAAFFEQLAKVTGPEVGEFARWVLDTAPDHSLEIDWGEAGPVLKYTDEATGDSFTLGQLRKDGVFAETFRLYDRFVTRGLPLEICRDYFKEVARLVAGASVRQFVSKSGRSRWEQIAYGQHPKPGDHIPLAELSPRKEEWLDAIDKTVQRIREIRKNI